MKVLVVDEMHESLVPILEELGLEVDYFYDFDYQKSFEVIQNYEGLLVRSKFFIDDSFLKKGVRLRFIGRAGAGLDLIDLDACKELGIEVFAANEANKVAVAEHLLGMVLTLFNNIACSNTQVKNDVWLREENRGEELAGKTVGIIGYGNNGSESAKRFVAFGCKVLAYDKYKSGFGTKDVKESTLENIFAQSDIVSLHIPLTKESKGWANADFFNSFSKNVYFCNVARGEIMVQADLIKALESGKVKGACLDVLENEKLKTLSPDQRSRFDYLKQHPKVLITPHVAGWTFQSYEKINLVLRDKIKAYQERVKQV
jgi:D-3-phosphoglycerate dehydrogenase